MNDKIAEYLEKLKDYWQKINNTQKIKMIVGVVATAAVLVVLFVWALTPEYTSTQTPHFSEKKPAPK